MKQKQLKKLSIKKETVINLNETELNVIRGGSNTGEGPGCCNFDTFMCAPELSVGC
jgi:natural product precursor